MLSYISVVSYRPLFFFFNDTATTEIYTLSLHDALPIYSHGDRSDRGGPEAAPAAARRGAPLGGVRPHARRPRPPPARRRAVDRKSTRLNSSHLVISYAVFCLKKNKIYTAHTPTDQEQIQ